MDGNLSTVQLAVDNGIVAVILTGPATISAGAMAVRPDPFGDPSGHQRDVGELVYQGMLDFTCSDTLTVTSTDSKAVIDVDTAALTVTVPSPLPGGIEGTGGIGESGTGSGSRPGSMGVAVSVSPPPVLGQGGGYSDGAGVVGAPDEPVR